jgi:CBS domain-containing protein
MTMSAPSDRKYEGIRSRPVLDLDRPELRSLTERYNTMEDDVKTHPLIGVRVETSLRDAAAVMSDRGVSALGVLDSARHLLGIVTERDLTWAIARDKDVSRLTVKDVLNDFPVVLERPLTRSIVLDRMKRARIRHVIVREEVDQYSIISMRDIVDDLEKQDSNEGAPDSHIALDPAPDDIARAPARRFMTTPAVVCNENDTLETVTEMLVDREISGLPVVADNGKVVGVVSEADVARVLGTPLLRLALHPRHSGPFLRDTPAPGPHTAADVMSSPPIVAHPDTPLHTVAEIMTKKRVNRLPIVEDGRLVGVVTRGDLLSALSQIASA